MTTDPDATPRFARRELAPLLLGAVVLAGLFAAAAGRAWVQTAAARRAERLHQIAFTDGPGRRLTDAEFEEAMALAEPPDRTDRKVRGRALTAAARFVEPSNDEVIAAIRGDRPDPAGRRQRLAAVAARLLDASDAADQDLGVLVSHLAGIIELRERLFQTRFKSGSNVSRSADGTVRGLDVRVATALADLDRPLTSVEFARAVELPTYLSNAAAERVFARVADTALQLIDSPEPEKRAIGLKALGRVGRLDDQHRAIGGQADPHPLVRLEADRAVRQLNHRFVASLYSVDRPLTAVEFARAYELVASSDPDAQHLAITVIEAAAGRSTDHKGAALDLFARLAADGADPQRGGWATEARDRLTGVTDVRP